MLDGPDSWRRGQLCLVCLQNSCLVRTVAGKTTFLIQLPYLLHKYLAAANGRQEFMEIGAMAGLSEEQAKRFLEAMQNSLVCGKLLVSWIR